MYAFSKETLLSYCTTPLLITWTTPVGTLNSETGEIATEDTLHEKKLKVSIVDKKFATAEGSVVINIIPVNDKLAFIMIEDKINFSVFTDEEKNTLRAILYYNTDYPVNVSIDLGSVEIIYFMNRFEYPESQKLLLKVI
jgi:hypothetical protein